MEPLHEWGFTLLQHSRASMEDGGSSADHRSTPGIDRTPHILTEVDASLEKPNLGFYNLSGAEHPTKAMLQKRALSKKHVGSNLSTRPDVQHIIQQHKRREAAAIDYSTINSPSPVLKKGGRVSGTYPAPMKVPGIRDPLELLESQLKKEARSRLGGGSGTSTTFDSSTYEEMSICYPLEVWEWNSQGMELLDRMGGRWLGAMS